jgi:hypothetical protein
MPERSAPLVSQLRPSGILELTTYLSTVEGPGMASANPSISGLSTDVDVDISGIEVDYNNLAALSGMHLNIFDRSRLSFTRFSQPGYAIIFRLLTPPTLSSSWRISSSTQSLARKQKCLLPLSRS